MRWKWLTVGSLGSAMLVAGLFKQVTLAQAQGRWMRMAVDPLSHLPAGNAADVSRSASAVAYPPSVTSISSSDAKRLRELLVNTQQDLNRAAAQEQTARQTITQLRATLSRREDQLEELSAAFELAWGTERTGNDATVSDLPDVSSAKQSVSTTTSSASSTTDIAAASPLQAIVTNADCVKVYQVNTELNVLILDMEQAEWAKPGVNVLLLTPKGSVATAELTTLDQAGFLIAHVTHWLQSQQSIQKGDLLFARPLYTP